MTWNDSPIGTTVKADIESKRAERTRYRDAQDRLQPFEQLARFVIMRRARLGLSQEDLATRMGTTASVISRIESGQHRSSIETLRRLAQALGGHAVISLEFGTARGREQEIVRL